MELPSKKRVIVVLGMHRCGTSAITRALVAIGAQAGNNLLPAGPDNPKGFWEDRDFVMFNERLLARLDASYDSLALLPESFEMRSEVAALQLEAAMLLREKLASSDLFALKDPRTCRLLPFWQRIFAHLGIAVDYVIAVRHPLSAAQSLSVRNGFPQRKSLWLWLQHYAVAMQATRGMARVFVDYDQLLASPEDQLQRLATVLQLPCEAGAIREYVDNFLNPDLRHSTFTPDDLGLIPDAPEVLIRAYRLLLSAVAKGSDAEFDDAWCALASDLRQQKGMLDFLQEYDRQVQGLQQDIQHRDQLLSDERQASAVEAARLSQRLEEEAARLEQSEREKVNQRQRSDQEIARLNTQLEQLRHELRSVYGSRSMRLTSPLRKLADLLRGQSCSGRLAMARCRQLADRSCFVLRQEGLTGFCRRTAGYIERSFRRRLAVNRLDRFVIEGKVSDLAPPLVSFIIPIYDRTDVLREAVRSALAQSLPVLEVILVTDGSPPDTLSVVEEFRSDPRVRIFNYPTSSGNAVRGRNKGILEARGRYIAFLDSDDIAAPDRLEVCLPLLESGSADVVYGAWRAKLDGTREIDGLTDGQVVYSPDCDLEMLRQVCVPCQSTVMVRRELFLKAGFLKPRMEYREDHELWARLAYYGARFKAVEHVLTDLRLHAGNNELNFKGDDSHWERLFFEEYRRTGPHPQKIGFLLGSLGISGGAAVVLRHVSMLIEQGHDAFVITVDDAGDIAWFGNPAIRVYRLNQLDRCGVDNIDMLFATFWTTAELMKRIPARRKLYFVQSDERLFYEEQAVRAQVAETYRGDYEYVAIARWICDMLRNEFGRPHVHYVPNGIDLQMFHPDSPLEKRNPQRLRILIEGPISVPFKGVAEAWEAVSGLDCELWIVSSSGRPEAHWRYDRFFESVDHSQMRQIYASCDVLLKMSKVESFAYPPLEAMACGCVVVLGEVRGGIEYAEHEINVLKVGSGNVVQARAAVQRLIDDEGLRKRLQEAGFETARAWSWESSRTAMRELVEEMAHVQEVGIEHMAARGVSLPQTA